jgi:choloylglycine hydrolase
MPRSVATLLLCCITLLAGWGEAPACTSIRIKTADGLVFYARTMEYAVLLHSGVSVVPRGTEFVGTLPDGSSNGRRWRAKYAFVGMNAYGLPVLIDGFNEKGLIVGGLVFPSYTGYQPFDPAASDRTIAQYEIPNLLLANYATVAEVRSGLGATRVCQGPTASQGVTVGPLPLHFTVHDATGDSLVIEYIDGTLHLHDNPLGVLTNAPPFDWMETYLSNYVNLSAVNVPIRDLKGFTVHQFGQGSGMLGLPGDFTPPSRFLRMVALTQAAQPVTGPEAGLNLAMTIIDNVDIPVGAVRDTTGKDVVYELTQWACAADPGRGRLYFRTYDNKNWHYVDLNKALAGATGIINFSIVIAPDYPDVTATGKALP